MSTTINITNSEAFRRRVESVLEALTVQGVTKDDVQAEFLAACTDREAARAAWKRVRRLDNPTAAELGLYARVLQVNTTWLITGDVRFINPGLMAGTCLCWLVPEKYHFDFYGATEPGSTHEYNPDCLVHGPELTHERLQRTALMDLVLGRKLPKPAIDLDLSALVPATAANYSETEV
ncbi:UNVERIFIED_ORG: hypothetical protein ABIB52_000542 [Arthrobacter sp. UYCu721]